MSELFCELGSEPPPLQQPLPASLPLQASCSVFLFIALVDTFARHRDARSAKEATSEILSSSRLGQVVGRPKLLVVVVVVI